MSTLTAPALAPRLRTAGITSFVGAAGFIVLFIVTNFIATTIAPLPDFPLPADAPKYFINGVFTWFGSIVWSIGLIVAVIGLNRLLAAGESVVASAIRVVGLMGAGAVALGGGHGLAQYGGLVATIADSGADEGAQKAVYTSTWVAANGYVFTAILLIAVWLVASAVIGMRSGASGAVLLVLTAVVALLAVATSLLTGFPVGGLVITLYLVVAGIVFLVRARRTRA